MNLLTDNIVTQNSSSCTPSIQKEFFLHARCDYLEEIAFQEKAIQKKAEYERSLEKVTCAFDAIGDLNGQFLSLSSFENNSNSNSNFKTEYSVCPILTDKETVGKVTAVIERERKRDPREKEWAQYKERFAFEQNVHETFERYDPNSLGLLTLTFADCPTWPEASRRWDSFKTGYLSKQWWWSGYLTVKEYQIRGSIHYHMLIPLPEDIRTGFDFAAVAKGDYRSASPLLRGIWTGLRKVLPKYKFGRHELKPIMGPYPNKPLIPGTPEAKQAARGMAKYLGKYLTKSFRVVGEYNDEEKKKDKKERKVWHGRYQESSRGFKTWSSKFQFFKNGGMWWRQRVRIFASLISDMCNVPCTWEGMKSILGTCWVYNFGDIIKKMTDNVFENISSIEEGMISGCLSASMHLVWEAGMDTEWLRLHKYEQESPPNQQTTSSETAQAA